MLNEQFTEIFQKALDYLVRREHSAYELEKKLQRKFPEASSELMKSVMEKLQTLDFQSDDRFKEVFIRGRFFSRNGPRKIQYDLRKKGIKEEVDLDEFDFDQTAYDLARIRFARDVEKYEKMDFKDQQKFKDKIYRLLASRGFSYDSIKKAVSKLLEKSD